LNEIEESIKVPVEVNNKKKIMIIENNVEELKNLANQIRSYFSKEY